MIKIKFPKKKTNKQIENFFQEKGLSFMVVESKKRKLFVNEMTSDSIYVPELHKLYNLYQYILLNKRTTILEFGSGWSSLVFHIALTELKNKYSENVKKLRRNNPFELFILENSKKYLNISKKRITKFQKEMKLKKPSKTRCYFSEVEMTTYNGRIATQYKNLPICNPDFIYLDGPEQFRIKKKINGINLAHPDMMPMVSDILKLEFFLTPGTIIVCDGRAANVHFLRSHFKRKWRYINDNKNEQHIFYLDCPLLGKFSKLQVEFYK
jgi:hypothetical protein